MKKQVDFLIIQITEKKFESLYVYVNNICHLLSAYQKLAAYFEDVNFRKLIEKKDKDFLLDIYTAGKVILGLLNFIKVMQYEYMKIKLDD
ncbi:hypothetical protein [Pantoea ananatis]|uniref:hypothetical protein n=1 Tax=Pantoea ananas TaxID=553 RepID=UPI001F4DF2AB|nr:hypothetical protein [Pantoea ananatis]MCH9271901.1 hypothetical protein [Pantoea ananatis]